MSEENLPMEQEPAPTPAEPAAPEAPAADAGQQVAELKRQLQEQKDQMLRLRAEMENLRRRAERDVESAHRYALERFALDLLPIKDSLELGVAAGAAGADAAKLVEGKEMTLRIMQTALEKFGIREINPVGERFNPELHQAMAAQPAEGVEPNTVVTVYQKGYQLNDRLLRPALVIVATGAADAGAPKIDEKA